MRIFSIILVLFIVPITLLSQTIQDKGSIKIMFYNVENLFDTVDDPNTNDDEFTPFGDRHWTNKKLDQKIEKTAKVIVAAGGWETPAMIGLCEVENLFVLEKLANHPLLKKSNYRIIHKDSPDHRGIDVAILYRSDWFKPNDYETMPILINEGDTIATREILHVEGQFQNKKNYHIFVNHWPSRYGGLMETESNRKLAAVRLKHAISTILHDVPEANIICMGDFNDQPTDESICKILGASVSVSPNENDSLINLSASWISEPTGTIKHRQEWAIFDQFIVSRNLLETTRPSIFSEKFLLEPDNKFTGFKPFRTYTGFRYNGGFSDHLPILLEIKK